MSFANSLTRVIATRSAAVLWVCLLTICVRVGAQEPPERADVRLVIDISGSMKRNDPANLRKPAVDLLVQLLPDGSYAGIWTFGRQVNMLVPFQRVDDQWREQARLQAGNISSTGLFTNIGEALEKAASVPSPPEAGKTSHVILLTDGMVDIDRDPAKNQEEKARILNDLLPMMQAKGAKIHTIALSESADAELMKQLALATDGFHTVAESADELLTAFLNAFDASAPADQLPIGAGNGFLIDSSIEEFTALIFRRRADEATQLVSPDGTIYLADKPVSNVRWHRAETYDLLTVAQPLEGEWKVLADIAPESRVTVVSNLGLRLRPLPINLLQGDAPTIQFAVLEGNTTITDQAFLALLSAKAVLNQRTDNAALVPVWSTELPTGAASGRGIFTVAMPPFTQAGAYRLDLEVDGRTFQRRVSHPLQVNAPFSLRHSELSDDSGQAGFQVQVLAHTSDLVPEKTQVVASIVGPDRRKLIRPLQWGAQNYWQTEVMTYASGDHIVSARVTGEDASGQPFQYDLGPIVLGIDPHSAFVDPPEEPAVPEVVQAPEVAEPPPVVQQPEPAADELEDGVPRWILIGLFVLGNLIVVGLCYPFIRRRLKGFQNQDPLDHYPETSISQKPSAAPVASAGENRMNEPEPKLDEFDMEEAGGTDDEPQMEDLNNEFDMEFGELEPMAMETPESDDKPLEVPEIPSDDDFGVDDIEKDIVDWATDGASDEDKQDFAAEMLKAQGLDLDEDELDDAISHLIEELDGESHAEVDSAAAEQESDDVDPLTGFKRRR